MTSGQTGRLRVLVFTIQLGSGGAEMQAMRIANHLDRSRFDVEFAVMTGGGSYEKNLARDVPLHVLPKANLVRQGLALRQLIRRRRPDIVCSFLEIPNLMAAAACVGMQQAPHVVACVQAPPSITWRGGGWRRLLLRVAAGYYGRAKRVIAISRGVAGDIAGLAPSATAHTDVVFNAGVDEQVLEGSREPLAVGDERGRGPLLVGCGRLVEQKGFPYLIEAFAKIRARIPDAELWVVGEGVDRPALEAQIEALSLTGAAKLIGFRDNPYRYMAAADIFVLSSVFEGFGNVIVEAMACGAPVVSTDCPYGPSEIITNGENGILVPVRDSQALADGVLMLLENEPLKRRIAKAGKRRADDFTSSNIAREYAKVFERLVADSDRAG